MRPLLIAVVLLSCAGDDARRREPIAERVAGPRVAPPAANPPATVAPAPTPVEVAAVDPRESTRKAAHDVLAQYCGECHEGHRSKKPEALAIYDLDLPDWPGRFNAHRFQTALGRLDKKPAPASQVFVAFRDAELAAASAP
jgi:hypothetical protein